jgi:hypothetical protein
VKPFGDVRTQWHGNWQRGAPPTGAKARKRAPGPVDSVGAHVALDIEVEQDTAGVHSATRLQAKQGGGARQAGAEDAPVRGLGVRLASACNTATRQSRSHSPQYPATMPALDDDEADCLAEQASALNPPKPRPEAQSMGAGSTPCTELPALTFAARQQQLAHAARHAATAPGAASAQAHTASWTEQAGFRPGSSEHRQSETAPALLVRRLQWLEREDAQAPSLEEPENVGYVGLAKRSSCYDAGARRHYRHDEAQARWQDGHARSTAGNRLRATAARAASNSIWQAAEAQPCEQSSANEEVAAHVRHLAARAEEAFEQTAQATIQDLEGAFQV